MNKKVIADSEVYITTSNTLTNGRNDLDVKKLRILLNNLGFSPIASGTQYIVEELEYIFNNNLTGIKDLTEIYIISSQKHNIDIHNIIWDVQYAISVMNRYADTNLLHEIFFWYDTQKRVTPRYFMSAMIDYLNENYEKYQK